MTAREIEQLLGGYATNTLTGEERRTLFQAALGNQALFDALADEQALKELLDDPAARAHLLAVLGEKRESAAARAFGWLRRPSVLALSGAVAAAIILIAVVRPGRLAKPVAAPVVVATRQPALPPAAGAPVPPPVPAAAPAPTQRVLRDGPANQVGKSAAVNKEAEADAKKLELQAEVQMARNAPLPPPPPPPPAAAAPALTGTMSSAAPAPAQSSSRSESRGQVVTAAAPPVFALKAAPAIGARSLYYAATPPIGAFGAFTDRSLEKQKKALGRSSATNGVAGGVPAAADLRAPGIRYSILERAADGSAKEVDPAAPIGAGESIRIRFEANLEGDLAVMRRGADGSWTSWGTAHLRVGEPAYMPAEDFVTAPGELRFFVRFARAVRAEARADQVTPTAGLLREQSGDSVYVVNPVRAAESAVGFELSVAVQ